MAKDWVPLLYSRSNLSPCLREVQCSLELPADPSPSMNFVPNIVVRSRRINGRSVGRLALITAIANSTELQFAIPTRVSVYVQWLVWIRARGFYLQVGSLLSIWKRAVTRMTLITHTLGEIRDEEPINVDRETYKPPSRKMKVKAIFDLRSSCNFQT